MVKKPQKSIETRTAENYFPIHEGDFKNTTEKEEKSLPTQQEIVKKAFFVEERGIVKEEFLKGSVEKKFKKPDRRSLETSEKIRKPNGYKKNGKKRKRASNSSLQKLF